MSLTRRFILGGAICAASLPPAAGRAASSLAQSSLGTGGFESYSLVSGLRDRLSDLFEREFITPQIARGVPVWSFADLDHPERFVWLRGCVGPPPISGSAPSSRPFRPLRLKAKEAARRCDSAPPSCRVKAKGELTTRSLTPDEVALLALDPRDIRTRPESPGVSRDA